MTLMYEHDLDILKAYHYTITEISRSVLSKVRARIRQTHTDRQTDRQTERCTGTHYYATFKGRINNTYIHFTLLL